MTAGTVTATILTPCPRCHLENDGCGSGPIDIQILAADYWQRRQEALRTDRLAELSGRVRRHFFPKEGGK